VSGPGRKAPGRAPQASTGPVDVPTPGGEAPNGQIPAGGVPGAGVHGDGVVGGAGGSGGESGPRASVVLPGTALRILAAVVLAAASVQAAAVESFLVPLHVGRWPLPVSVLAAVLGNVVLARSIVRFTGNRRLALVPPLLWLAVVVVLSLPRPEGDLVVPGTWTGLAFLFGGAAAGAFGAASTMMPSRRHGIPGQARARMVSGE
jgi:Family of unknown function (DUF6113)